METFGVQRAAVRQALAMLRSEGVVERLQGIGTFAVRDRFVTGLSEIHGKKESGGLLDRARPEPLDETVVPGPEFVAAKLDLEPGENVLRLEYVSYFDGAPQGVATNYVAFPEADALSGTPFKTDWYQLLRDSELTIGSSEWVLGAINADPSVASLLELSPVISEFFSIGGRWRPWPASPSSPPRAGSPAAARPRTARRRGPASCRRPYADEVRAA
jgi:GntR family transcriptional regulator